LRIRTLPDRVRIIAAALQEFEDAAICFPAPMACSIPLNAEDCK